MKPFLSTALAPWIRILINSVVGTSLNLWVLIVAVLKLKGFSTNTCAVAESQHVIPSAAVDVCKFSVPLQVAANLGIVVPPLMAQLIGFVGGVYVKAKYKAGGYGHCEKFKAEAAAKMKK